MSKVVEGATKAIKLIDDWHGHEGIDETVNNTLSCFTAALITYEHIDNIPSKINAYRILIETIFQYGRAHPHK